MKLTVEQAIKSVATFPPPSNNNVEDFINEASARDLMFFIQKASPFATSPYHNHANIALSVRLAEDATKTAELLVQQTNRLVQYSEKLTNQTDVHIHYSEKLTQQIEELLRESISLTKLTRQLRFWTIMLGLFAVMQIVIMIYDYLKHK